MKSAFHMLKTGKSMANILKIKDGYDLENKDSIEIKPDDLYLSDDLLKKMPSTVRKYIEYGSKISDVPNEFLLTPFLALVGALIGKKRKLQFGGISVFPVIWTVLFAESSFYRKSTALSIARGLFKSIIENWKEVYNLKLADWQRQQKEAKEAGEPFDVPEPKKRTLYASDNTSDVTFWESLRDNGNLIAMPSEFTGMWTDWMKTYNSLRDIALRIFDAEDHIRRHTRMGGDIELENPILCIAGATTIPAFQKALSATERGNGLLQRILPVTVVNRTKKFMAITELPIPDAELYKQLSNRLQEIARMSSRDIHLLPEASQIYTEWAHDIHERALNTETTIHDIGGYVSRLQIYAVKFALIFQTLEDENKDISLENMQGAIALSEWLFKHQIFMLTRNYIFNRHYADRLKLLEVLDKNGGQLSRTGLMNLTNFDKEQLDRAIENEIQAGHIKEHKIETGGRPRYEYEKIGGDDV
jgi:hypothetical protein